MAIIGLWRFNGNSNDAVGANNGTSSNVTYSVGKLNGGVTYTTSNTSNTIIPQSSLGTSIRTHNFWLKSTFSALDNPVFIDYQVASFANDRFSIRILGSDSGALGKIRVFLRGASGQNVYRDSLIAINDGIWRNICVIVNITSVTINIYINGVLNQGAQTGTVLSAIDTTNLMINKNNDATNGTGMTFDELIIDNAAWSASQIKNEYSRVKGFF